MEMLYQLSYNGVCGTTLYYAILRVMSMDGHARQQSAHATHRVYHDLD